MSCTANRAKPCVDTHWWLLFYETKPNAGVACVRDIRYARYSVSTSVTYLYRGGEGGIRTPDTVARMPHFECGAFNHSATSPG